MHQSLPFWQNSCFSLDDFLEYNYWLLCSHKICDRNCNRIKEENDYLTLKRAQTNE